MQWGQFVAHDVSNLAIDTDGEGTYYNQADFKNKFETFKLPRRKCPANLINASLLLFLDCCSYENQTWVSRRCEAIIKIPVDDPVYSKYNKTCMRFSRAMTTVNYSCPIKPSTFVSHSTDLFTVKKIYEYFYRIKLTIKYIYCG